VLWEYKFLFTPFAFTPPSSGTHLGRETTLRFFWCSLEERCVLTCSRYCFWLCLLWNV